MNNIDKLFKTKLNTYEVSPSADAWQKLSTNLSQKRSRSRKVWMSIAASITLIMLSITLYNNDTPVENNAPIAKSVLENPNSHKQILKEEIVKEPTIAIDKTQQKTTTIADHLADDKLLAEGITRQNAVKEKEFDASTNVDMSTSSADSLNTNKIQEKKITADLSVNNEDLLAEDDGQNDLGKSSSVKIVYNLQPAVKIDSSVLMEKSTTLDSKSGVLGKIVAFAKNAKASDVSLGQLRAAKDNLLNIDNLRNNKQTQK